ncbi:hypothetical protein OG401_35525 [Kitasatospora purpeofusca]|uniref:pPIWI_RE_Y domain-containing protein n=1 Tax=Kitasatospora purpeofusca TaxID=67352 RepID=UPI002254336E|nr:hypothetical protein [Kitasatospora purpeofusca]MCX4689547.1 hypothetical protein [Kitasatospora purpeofusca]
MEFTPEDFSLPDGGWAAHRSEALFRLLATALVGLGEVGNLESFALPYPPDAQMALDRVVLACLLESVPPPASLTELVTWCQRIPLADWPVALPERLAGSDDRLLDEHSARPTQLCYEWVECSGGAAELDRERLVMRTAERLSREYGEEEAYEAFVRLLVDEPVLTIAEMFAVAGRLRLEPVKPVIEAIYQEVPDSYLRDDEFVTCMRCRTLLVPVVGAGWWCEQDSCRRSGAPTPGRRLPLSEHGKVFQLEYPLRIALTGPRRTETELAERLVRLGLTVRPLTGSDGPGLKVMFPDGTQWIAELKDRVNPSFLARGRVAPDLPDRTFTEVFWVVPQHRVDSWRGYIETFENARSRSAAPVRLVTDGDLLERARHQARGLTGARRA